MSEDNKELSFVDKYRPIQIAYNMLMARLGDTPIGEFSKDEFTAIMEEHTRLGAEIWAEHLLNSPEIKTLFEGETKVYNKEFLKELFNSLKITRSGKENT